MIRFLYLKKNGVCMSQEKCNCNDDHCKGDKSKHKHEGGKCIHPDGTRHPIHEKH